MGLGFVGIDVSSDTKKRKWQQNGKFYCDEF
jgi:hypothetical protein